MDHNTELIEKFYTAFKTRDWKNMNACYHNNAHFSDPVFQNLDYERLKAMWHMLCLNGKDLIIEFRDINCDEESGTCHWEAWYSFSKTGRKVHNVIEAKFHFKDGLIVSHHDSFNLWKWTQMALGVTGYLLGWTPIGSNKVRSMAMKNLEKFIENTPLTD
jgi:ketosteroid isomerase-like protein